MSKVIKLEPTGWMRFVRVDGSPSDSRVPLMRCGIHFYKLQQKWLGQDASIAWLDVEIDRTADRVTGDT